MNSQTDLVTLQQTLYTSSNPTRRWLHCTRRDWIFDAVKRHAGLRERALEVGPGSGIYLPLLADLFGEVFAIDIEDAYLNNARPLMGKYPNLKLQADDITASTLPAHSFDMILCTEVVEHIADSAAAIAGMQRLLKPGGVLILSTPQRYSPLELAAKIAFLPGIIQIVRMIYREPILETGHINLMTAATAERQLTEAGLHIHERYKSGMYIPFIAEFAGQTGMKLEQWLERKLLGSFADGILWTQYYVARSV